MKNWKRALLNGYYYTTLPFRLMSNWQNVRSRCAPVVVLFYHRVADHVPNEWTTPTRTFHKQLDWLTARFDIVSLEDAQSRLRFGFNQRPAVSITFDDGYADNMDFALPLLLERGIPFTYFVASQHALQEIPFPHDVEAGNPLAPTTVDQLASLVAAGVEIGAHSRSHADLGSTEDPKVLQQEIVGAKTDLEVELSCPVRYFAFPYGLHENLSPEAFAVAREAGYRGVCSAYGGYNLPGVDAFHLQRIHADNDMIRFKNWLTVDPRKLATDSRYQYQTAKHKKSMAGSTPL